MNMYWWKLIPYCIYYQGKNQPFFLQETYNKDHLFSGMLFGIIELEEDYRNNPKRMMLKNME